MIAARHRVAWTRKEEAEVVRLRTAERLSYREIALVTSRTRRAIRCKLTCLGLAKPGNRPRYAVGKLARHVVRLYRPGVSLIDVAKILGVHRSCVQMILRRKGIRGVNPVNARFPPASTIRRPVGHEWRKGELTVCLIRLMSLNHGLGISHAETAERLNVPYEIIKWRKNALFKGIVS